MSDYHFTTHWILEASCEEVYHLLEDIETLSQWWPSVYLDIKMLEKGDSTGVGNVLMLYTKGFLPYTLQWKLRVTKTYFPYGFSLEATGDFMGNGVWTFTQKDQKYCEVVYDWQIKAEKPLLKYLSWLLRPIFSANHFWAMKKGEDSIKLELLRRRAKKEGKTVYLPPPPPPTFPHNLTNNKIL